MVGLEEGQMSGGSWQRKVQQGEASIPPSARWSMVAEVQPVVGTAVWLFDGRKR